MINYSMDKFTRFKSTIWTLIKEAGQKDTRATNEFVSKYRAPVVSFIMKNGFSEDDAEDLAQEVFMRLFEGDILAKAERSKGRFRDLLLAITKNVIRYNIRKRMAKKRGGDQKMISIEEFPELHDISIKIKDVEFDRLWMLNILRSALKRLKRECESKGLLYYVAIKEFSKGDTSYEAIAKKLGKNLKEIENYIYRARAKLRRFIAEEISFYSSSEEEYEDEIRYLSSYLKRL